MDVKPGYKQTELGTIPEEWDIKKLEEIVYIRSGGTPSTTKSEYWDGNIPWCTPTDVTALKGKKYLYDTNRKITFEGLQSSSAEIVPINSLIMTSRATIGESAINQIPVSTNQGFKNLIPFENLSVEFLYYLLQTKKQDLISLCGGSTFLEIGKSQLASFKVQCPTTKAEQEAIAEALSDADAYIESLEHLIAKKRQIRQGAIQELLRPKKEYVQKELGEICTLSKERFDPLTADSEKACVELEHLSSKTGRLLSSFTTKGLRSQKAIFQKGDILFGKLRPYLRKYWRATFEGVCSTEIWVIKPNIGIDSEWLYWLIQTDQVVNAANKSTGTKMPRADWGTVKQTEVGVPPTIEEQTAIAAILSDIDAEIDALETKLTKARHIKQGMMQELLTGRIRLI